MQIECRDLLGFLDTIPFLPAFVSIWLIFLHIQSSAQALSDIMCSFVVAGPKVEMHNNSVLISFIVSVVTVASEAVSGGTTR